MKKHFSVVILLTAILFALSSNADAQHAPKGMLSIGFHHYVDSLVLQLDSATYKNSFGQSFTISKFKYYISNIQLTGIDGRKFISTDYFLINEDEEESKKISLNFIPAGTYSSISFTVGVDSLHNCSGAQSGALDPTNTMFWAWNSGYIFLKLEGKSSYSTSPGHIFEYHIGGYRSPDNCIRSITLKFNTLLQIQNEKISTVGIKVNAAEILKEPVAINFQTLPTVTDSHNATTIADNYMDMFSVDK